MNIEEILSSACQQLKTSILWESQRYEVLGLTKESTTVATVIITDAINQWQHFDVQALLKIMGHQWNNCGSKTRGADTQQMSRLAVLSLLDTFLVFDCTSLEQYAVYLILS